MIEKTEDSLVRFSCQMNETEANWLANQASKQKITKSEIVRRLIIAERERTDTLELVSTLPQRVQELEEKTFWNRAIKEALQTIGFIEPGGSAHPESNPIVRGVMQEWVDKGDAFWGDYLHPNLKNKIVSQKLDMSTLPLTLLIQAGLIQQELVAGDIVKVSLPQSLEHSTHSLFWGNPLIFYAEIIQMKEEQYEVKPINGNYPIWINQKHIEINQLRLKVMTPFKNWYNCHQYSDQIESYETRYTYGTWLMCCLHKDYPQYYRLIKKTEFDPSENNDLITNFWKKLEEIFRQRCRN